MYWTSPLVARAVTLGLVDPRRLGRLARRVRRLAHDFPSSDAIWADELARERHITRYQAQALLQLERWSEIGSPRSGTSDPRPFPDADLCSFTSALCLDGLPLQIGPYIVFDCAGRSDLGATYRCRLPGGREEMAVKLLHSAWAQDPATRERIVSESRGWTSLGHPHARVGEVLDAGGSLAVVSRWTQGHSLAALLAAGRRPSPEGTARLAADLIHVLAAADARGLIHGDLKLVNMLVCSRTGLVVTDAGVRRSIARAAVTVHRDLPPDRYDCIAPEIAFGDSGPDAASDIYAFGCVLYHLVTGRPPFWGGDAERKCAAHRAGRLFKPHCLGVATEPSIGRLLDATLQPDRSIRAASYNELLGLLAPVRQRTAQRLGRMFRSDGAELTEPGLARRAGALIAGPVRAARRWRRTVAGAVAGSALLAIVAAGTGRLTQLVSIPSAHRPATARPVRRAVGPPVSTVDSTRRAASPHDDVVTTIWSASDELRRAYEAAPPHGTITLQSPGPFLMDAVEIRKPITLRGADSVRPLFLGGPGAALRVAADDVCLENLHFVRVASSLAGQTRHDSPAVVEFAGDNGAVRACSWHILDTTAPPPAAIRWNRTLRRDGRPSLLELKHVTWSGVDAGVLPVGDGAMRLVLENSVHRGAGELVRSTSTPGAAFDSIELHFTRVTVAGSGLVRHRFPHPIDGALPLRIIAEDCLIVPRDRDQPILSVAYAAQPVTLMPKVSWSGSSTICPADATTLAVDRGPEASPWRAADVAAWNAYWGAHPTGLIGAPLDFASAPDDIASTASLSANSTAGGADQTQLALPPRVALEQLPLLMKRL